MMNANTGLLQRTLLKVSQNNSVRLILEVLFLLGLGALAALLHAKLKVPLQLPGRQGMMFMAVLILGRMSSHLGPASFISCLGSSALLLGGAFSFGDPFSPVIYPILGIVLDVLYRFSGSRHNKLFMVSLIAGVAWMTIPACRLLISSVSSYPFHSLRYGPVIPILTHLIFGFTGGILGYSLSRILDRKSDR